jgi:excisionase family DNA binding protein
LPGLDDFYKYIEKQEKKQTASARDSEGGTDGVAVATPVAEVVNGVATAAQDGNAAKKAGASQNGVRYVLRNGITVPVEVESEAATDPSHTNGNGNGSNHLPLISRADPAPSGTGFPSGTTLEDAVAMWQKLPRHIQLLASIEVSDREEVAQKYYTRGFRETRQQLIERLLNPTLTLEETARVLGVCPATVRRYTNRGVLPHYRTIGQQRRFRLSDVLSFLEQQQHERSSSSGRGSRKEAA